MEDYDTLDGLALGERVRRGDVSAVELAHKSIRRIEEGNAALNAVVTRRFDAALAEAAAMDKARAAKTSRAADEVGASQAFAGVPFLVKELVASVTGTETTSASRLYAGTTARADSEIVARMRRAGLVIMGKTNSPEFGLSPTTESLLYGVTRNPWNVDLSPGGSSGGSAAAVAAGMVPLAHATDGGGSIRIPASCCGLFGLKPTRARVSAGPEGGEGLSGLAHQHVVTRSVRDSAALLDAIAGPMSGDPYSAAPPVRPFLEEVGLPPGRLRIAISARAPTGVPVDAECVAALHDAARLCESLGHHVEEASPEFDAMAVESGFETVFACNTHANIVRKTGGAPAPEGSVEPLTRALAERGSRIDAATFILALQGLHRESRRVAGFFERYDVWLTPTLAQTPRPIGAFAIESPDVDAWLGKLAAYLPFTYLFNITGQPAASVPLYWTDAGVPIGVQIASRYGDEATLLRLAAQMEAARPWFDRRPPAPR